MPIQEWALNAPVNAHVAISGAATLRQAFAVLTSSEVNGEPWWHLVVARTDGTWGVAKYADLYTLAAADETQLDVPLDELDGLISGNVVEQQSIGTALARDRARRSPGKLLVVTDGGELVGILRAGILRGDKGPVSTSALTELAGEPADLAQYGHLLIKKRKPKKP
jgi:hypothetical protein